MLILLRFLFSIYLSDFSFSLFKLIDRTNVKHKQDKSGSYLQMVSQFVHFLAAKSKLEHRFDLKMTVSEIAFLFK